MRRNGSATEMKRYWKSVLACLLIGHVLGCILGTVPIAPRLSAIGYSIIHAAPGLRLGLRYWTGPYMLCLACAAGIFSLLVVRARRRQTEASWSWSFLFVSFALATLGSFAVMMEEFGE